MSEEQIVVRLNPDVPPTGSDLGITNAARRSFGSVVSGTTSQRLLHVCLTMAMRVKLM